MARSKIEWLARPNTIPESWSPISGCDPDDGCQSEACEHCWARRMSKRLAGRAGYNTEHPFRITIHRDKLDVPYSWKKTRTVFTVAMGDLFHHMMPWRWIDMVFDTMVHCRRHTFILCTKRAKNMHDFITKCYPGLDQCCPHIWGLVTAENQERADKRIPWLLRTPLAVRGVSVEPMLGEIDLREYLYPVAQEMVTVGQGPNVVGAEIEPGRPGLDWVIAGGETGSRARPTHPEWANWLKDQTVRAGVPFFWKSWGEWLPYPNYGDVAPKGKWTDEELDKYPFTYLSTTGEQVKEWRDAPSSSTHGMFRVGKRKSGHLLDGKEWHQWPTTY